MLKKLRRVFLGVLVTGLATVLATLAINAADRHDNFSASLIGQWFSKTEIEARCPADMIFVPSDFGGYCLDRYEAAAGEACPVKEPGSQADTRVNLSVAGCEPQAVSGRAPWRYISQAQAALACAKAGKRLPTPKEWYLAALGTPDKAGDWGPDDCQVASNWPDQPGAAGSGRECVSGAGAYDMVGNVWEWVEGEARDGVINGAVMPDSGFVRDVDSQGLPIATASGTDDNFYGDYFWIKTSDVRGLARGGYWDNRTEAGAYASYLVLPPAAVGPGIGFRCAR